MPTRCFSPDTLMPPARCSYSSSPSGLCRHNKYTQTGESAAQPSRQQCFCLCWVKCCSHTLLSAMGSYVCIFVSGAKNLKVISWTSDTHRYCVIMQRHLHCGKFASHHTLQLMPICIVVCMYCSDREIACSPKAEIQGVHYQQVLCCQRTTIKIMQVCNTETFLLSVK